MQIEMEPALANRPMLVGARAMAARAIRISRYTQTGWRSSAAGLLLCTTLITATVVGIGWVSITSIWTASKYKHGSRGFMVLP